jgi:hypothetical protein
MRKLFPQLGSPEDLPVFPLHRNYNELVTLPHPNIVVRSWGVVVNGCHRSADGLRGHQVNRIAPNNRRRMSLPRQGGFPLDVFRLTPFHRRVCLRRRARCQRPAPLWPKTNCLIAPSGGSRCGSRRQSVLSKKVFWPEKTQGSASPGRPSKKFTARIVHTVADALIKDQSPITCNRENDSFQPQGSKML